MPETSRTPSRWATAVVALRFVSELALVAGSAWAASTRPRVVLVAIAFGIVAALAVAAVWAVAVSPGSPLRLRDPARLAVEMALFLAVAAGLAAVGHLVPAVVLALLGAAAAVGVRRVAEPADAARAELGPQLDDAAAPMRRPRGRDRARPRK